MIKTANPYVPSLALSSWETPKTDFNRNPNATLLSLNNVSFRIITARAVGNKGILQQGDFKNAFCNTQLPDDGVTVIHPPIGNLVFQENEYCILKTSLYGLLRSPHNCYNIIKGIILKMVLNPSTHDPCIISVTTTNPYSSTCTPHIQYQLHADLYLYYFFFYSYYPAQEELSKTYYRDTSR